MHHLTGSHSADRARKRGKAIGKEAARKSLSRTVIVAVPLLGTAE